MKPKPRPFQNAAVKAVYDNCLPDIRARLLVLRELIFDTAEKTEGVGEIEETLKWNEPAYLTVTFHLSKRLTCFPFSGNQR